jgi:hypothetical protein
MLVNGKTVALNVPASGQDLGPLLFKSNVVVTNAKPPCVGFGPPDAHRRQLQAVDLRPGRPGDDLRRPFGGAQIRHGIHPVAFVPPRVRVTFWPATKQVSVRYVGEITNSEALEAFAYDLKLTAGKRIQRRSTSRATSSTLSRPAGPAQHGSAARRNRRSASTTMSVIWPTQGTLPTTTARRRFPMRRLPFGTTAS